MGCIFLNKLIALPVAIVNLLEGNISPREIAFGVCLGMFFGFTPLNGPMTIFLFVFFLLFRLNRIATLLTLPVFKIFYVSGMYHLTEKVGGYLLIDADYLTGFWSWWCGLPVIAYMDMHNTLVAGWFCTALALSFPLFFVTAIVAQRMQHVYAKQYQHAAFVGWIKKAGSFLRVIHIGQKIKDRMDK